MRLVTLAIVAAIVVGSGQSFAQSGGTIEGFILDPSGAVLQGIRVDLTGPALVSGAQTAVADSRGEYRFVALPAGTYELVAEREGFGASKRRVDLAPGATATVDLRLPLARMQSDVTVAARAEAPPMIDVRSAAAPVTLDERLLSNLPTNRSIIDTIDLAPGVSGIIAPGTGLFGNIAFGGTQASNGMLVDGMSLTDSGRGQPWVTLNYNWVSEVQVVGLGAPVDVGRTTGATVTAVLRSGTNQFSGLGEYWGTKAGWSSDNTRAMSVPLPTGFAPLTIHALWDADAQLGGPIVTNRMWFFTGFEAYHNANRPAGVVGPEYTTEHDFRAVLKVTTSMARNLTLEGLLEKGNQDIANDNLNPFVTTSATDHARQPDTVWNAILRWTGSNHTAFDLRVHGFVSPLTYGSMLLNGDAGPPPHYDLLTGIESGNTVEVAQYDRRSTSVAGSVTQYLEDTSGRSHQLRFGIDYQRNVGTDFTGYPGNRTYYDSGTTPNFVEFWNGDTFHFTGNQTAIYGEDRWSATPRVTVEAGLRVDVNRGSVPGAESVFRTTPLSPRIGFAWDLFGDHRTVVRAHYGRYADPLYGRQFSFLDRAGFSPDIYADIVGPDQFVPFSVGYGSAGANFTLDSALTHPHVGETVVGVEREVAPNVSITGQYIGRRFRDFIGVVGPAGAWTPVTRIDPGPDGVPGTSDDGGRLTLYQLSSTGPSSYLVTNPDNAFRDYDAWQVIGRKRYAQNWEMLAGYTWSRARGTVSSNGAFSNAVLDHYDLSWFGAFVDPNHLINQAAPFTASELKIEATYHASWLGGANLSGILRAQSGPPWRRTAFFSDLGKPETVIVEPTVTHYLPAQQVLDLRLEKTVRVVTRILGVYVDVFNATNQGVPTGINVASGPSFGNPFGWSAPRTVRAGIRLSY
jgi:hypothetical protein